jgi:outer membrane protein assembly factor BamB
VLLAGIGALGWRVLQPAAAIDRSGKPYPAAAAEPDAERYGDVPDAPLYLDGRLRVFAEKRRVWTDTAMKGSNETIPYWSYRRWPGQVVAVVAIEPTAANPVPMVVTRWSDGTVTGIDARAGRVAWEKRIAPKDKSGYTGRRTGAATVYRPRGLYTAGGALVVGGGGSAAGYDPWTGDRRWSRPAACGGDTARGEWTTTTAYVSRCGDRLDIVDAATGTPRGTWSGSAPEPWGCVLGQSGCRMLTSGGANFRLGDDGALAEAPAARPGTRFLVADGYVEWTKDSDVGVVDASSGRQRWQVPLHGYVVAADDDYVYLITTSHWLVALDATTGLDRARVPIPAARNWRAATVYAAHGFVAVERVIGAESDSDDHYFYATSSVVVLGT